MRSGRERSATGGLHQVARDLPRRRRLKVNDPWAAPAGLYEGSRSLSVWRVLRIADADVVLHRLRLAARQGAQADKR
jgi:hypothetical protein